MTAENSVRARRRAETVREIKDAALVQLAQTGAGDLSLRAVARAVGMTVQSLYHYFDSRDALLTTLITDAHHALADAVQAAADATRGQSRLRRRLAATNAFREWALGHRAAFLLLFGTPVPDFAPLPDGGTPEAAVRLAAPFVDVVFDGWSAAEIAAVPLLPGAEPIAAVDTLEIPLPAGALALLLEQRARMHGLVILELLGHTTPVQGQTGALFAGAMYRMSTELDEVQQAVQTRLAR